MIAKLYGKIDTLDNGFLIINVGGVGYLVFCSSRTLSKMPGRGEEAMLFIETAVREDAITLYGFADETEKACFNILTSVQGVGAKVAFAILSTFSPDSLELAIGSGDAKSLTRAGGVGAKLAARLITELKGKMGVGLSPVSSVGGDFSAALESAEAPSAAKDAVSALANLGYQKMDALMAVNKAAAALGADASVQALIKEALKEFAK